MTKYLSNTYFKFDFAWCMFIHTCQLPINVQDGKDVQGGNFFSKSIKVQTKIKPCRGDFFLKINKRACTSIRYTRVPLNKCVLYLGKTLLNIVFQNYLGIFYLGAKYFQTKVFSISISCFQSKNCCYYLGSWVWQSANQSVPNVLVLKTRVGLWPWKKNRAPFFLKKTGCKTSRSLLFKKRRVSLVSSLFK